MRAGWIAASSVATAFALTLAACSDYGAETPASDAGASSDANATASDAGASVDASATTCSKKGDLVRPIRAFDATPPSIDAGVQTCNVQAVLVEDGTFAGMDRSLDFTPATIDGQDVVSCIGVEMAPGVVIDRVLVRAQAVPTACNTTCKSGSCGTGDSFPIYVGATETDLVMAKNANDVDGTPKTIDVAAPITVAARFVVVCRSTFGTERDDIAVDSIAAICR